MEVILKGIGPWPRVFRLYALCAASVEDLDYPSTCFLQKPQQPYRSTRMPSKLGDNPEMTDSAAGFDLDQLVGTDSLSKVRIVLFNYLLTK